MSFNAQDAMYMARAIRLAERGLYTTDPNPRVGCVLAKNGRIVGEGWHKKAGEPHAERNALAAAGGEAKDATAYVTLEPCSHYGRTPPCSLGLIESGVARVVAAMRDPNPLVGGNGLKMLQAAGIQTEVGLMQAEAAKLNPGFIKRMTMGLPFVRCKLAMSLDGRTAMASGESKWISGDAARQDVQLLRARSSAVVTGIETVLADDPSMNVRIAKDRLYGVESEIYFRQPHRVVLDSHLRIPLDARMLTLPGNNLIITTSQADVEKITKLEGLGVEVLVFEQTSGRVELQKVMQVLAQRGLNEILIESGPTLAGAALQAGLVDELIVYQASHLMGSEARGLVHLPGLETMAERIQLQLLDSRKVGDDIRSRFKCY